MFKFKKKNDRIMELEAVLKATTEMEEFYEDWYLAWGNVIMDPELKLTDEQRHELIKKVKEKFEQYHSKRKSR